MANYYTPTAVQQPIPAIDITALERLLLANIFDMQIDDDALYFSSDEGVSDMLYLDVEQLRSCLDDPAAEGTTAWNRLSINMATSLSATMRSRSTHLAVGGKPSFRMSCADLARSTTYRSLPRSPVTNCAPKAWAAWRS